MSRTPFFDLLARTSGLDEAAFLAEHPAAALLVEPFVSSPLALQAPLTRKLSYAEMQRQEQEPALEPAVELEGGFKRSSDRFLHPDATVCWLEPGPEAWVEGILTLGRGERCDLVFPDETVSKVHALLHRRPDGWLIEDHASANGTFLNGTRLNPYARAAFEDRATLRLGRAVVSKLFLPGTLFRFCRLLRAMDDAG
ncbi:MAG: FHA domain-containing protein [Planctomycetota bacterium]